MAKAKYDKKYPLDKVMRVQARSGSVVEARYLKQSSLPGGAWRLPKPAAIAPGISPAPLEDLIYHGGKVVPQMEFQNIYLGGADDIWDEADVTAIDGAITRAMRDKRLENVIVQYFPGASPLCDARDSKVLDEAPVARLDESDVQNKIIELYDTGQIKKSNLDSTLFNLILPPGCVLALGGDTSLQGLGGFHGSVRFKRGTKRVRLYYSANVFSQALPSGRENGIVAFNKPWKNVVGTLYHEINEFRTDPDVNDANDTGNIDLLGWTSRRGHEIGDQPIFQAGFALNLVFKEVTPSSGSGSKIPVQFMYSNVVHGAEGPIVKPH